MLMDDIELLYTIAAAVTVWLRAAKKSTTYLSGEDLWVSGSGLDL